MTLRPKRLSHGSAKLVIIVFAAAALIALKVGGGFDGLDRNAFDLMSTLAPPRPDHPAAVIVAIDEPSFSALGKAWPWPRNIHAELIRSLRKAGAKTIGFDVVFADPTNDLADEALASAADNKTVLGADETIADTPQGTMLVRTEPLPRLTQSGARAGVTSIAIDPDGVVRRVPRYPDSFAKQFVAGGNKRDGQDRLIQYFGGPRTYPYVSYYQALDPAHSLPPGIFNHRDVMVGLVVQANPEVRQAPDSFETSFTARNGQLVPGIEIQATIVDNLRHHLWIIPAGDWIMIILLIGGCVLGYVAASPERLPVRLAAVLGCALLTIVSLWLVLRFGRVWASPVEPLSGLLASSAFLGVADFAAERRRRREIQNAFGQYVAPEIVRQIIDDPDRVKLGGERKIITVLFADIRGFTTISETLRSEPEKLTQLINEVLGDLSRIVTRHAGTIDKYIGDCVMAFWNAPLDDPEHADHAVRAALEMIESVASFRERAQGLEIMRGHPIEIGVGINSGECVVGNMGSDLRFDYTVIGDPVNVASRLEGLSKQYGVSLLIGEGTAAITTDQFHYVELDRICVRGKQTEQAVYTIGHLLSASAGLARSGGADG